MITSPRRLGEREDGGLDGRRRDGIEVATDGKEPTFTGNEVAAVALGGGDMFVEDGGRVVRVASALAVLAEDTDRVLTGQLQEGTFVEGAGADRRRSSRGVRRVGSRLAGRGAIVARQRLGRTAPSHAGEEREVREPDLPGLHGGSTHRQTVELLPAATARAAAWPDI